MCTCFITKITLQELCWCIFWILVIQNKSSLSPLKFVKILKIRKNYHFWQKKALKWSNCFIFVLFGSTNGGVDPKIKTLQCCISKLQAFVKMPKNCCWVHSNYTKLHIFRDRNVISSSFLFLHPNFSMYQQSVCRAFY